MKKMLIILFLLLAISLNATPVWQREIINYPSVEYKAGRQNWMIAQARNGWIYAANTDGLLEFDGVRWSLYGMRNNMVRSVLPLNERIYVGGSSEFGFFEYDDTGFLKYNSLSSQPASWAGEVWNVLELGGIIYFISDNYVHIYTPSTGQIEVIYCEAKINSSILFEGKLLLGTATSLMRIDKQQNVEPLTSTESIAQHKIIDLVVYKDKLLMVTARGGIYQLEDRKVARLHSEADTFIANNQLFSAIAIDSKLILGSVQNGVFILDMEKGSPSEQLNIQDGIINNTILNVFIDRSGNLWLALDQGISYINLKSPIRPLYVSVSPIGTGHCSMLYKGKLYLGTNQGVYTFGADGKYKLLPKTEGQIWSMEIIDDKLFCSGDNNITVVSPTEHYNLNVNSVWEVHPLRNDRNMALAGTYKGFSVLEKRNGKWTYSHNIEGVSSSMRGVLEDDEPYSFWYMKNDEVPSKVSFDASLRNLVGEKRYTIDASLLQNNRYFRRIDNNITIVTNKGLYNYSRLADSFAKYTELETMLAGEAKYNHLSVDRLGGIWYSTDKTMKLLPYASGRYNSQSVSVGALMDELTDNHQNIFRVDSANVIVAMANGFSSVSLDEDARQELFPIQTYIRDIISSKQDSILAYGNSKIPIRIPYENNSIKIEYSATAFSNTMEINYVYRLKKKDLDWSSPNASTRKEYTHLFEGNYVFEVVAIDPTTGKYGEVASLEFSILPPWYRSAYAYVVYCFFFLTLLYFAYRMTIDKQKKIINKQAEENAVKDQEIYELQNKGLKDELHYKTQELSGYILNVIRKNEMLEDVKKRAMGVAKALDDDDSRPIIKQKVTRLIGQIDNNIEKDKEFEVFQSNFDIVHQDFFKLLDEKLPDLTRSDKILCAYLNMNLSSKEIAPLLNISIRGVEVSRYRLRKKMGLQREDTLIEFLRNL